MAIVIIIGSSRGDGDSAFLANRLSQQSGWDVIDLSEYNIGYYDYTHANRIDDYLSLSQLIIDKYDTFVLLTPVYWYSMSGIMKVFIDRFTDLITIEKQLGHRLKEKKMAVISCSNGNNLGVTFWLPFVEFAKYLGIQYLGNLHTISGKLDERKLDEFINEVERRNGRQ